MSSESDRAARDAAATGARPSDTAFRELEQLVRHLAEDLATYRRRALQAEARVKALEAAQPVTPADLERLESLERENGALRQRLDDAAGRTRVLLDRVRFLRQQSEAGGGGGER